ncbi:MAG: hypothetical protein COV52_08455 [Gammaproteobacteria bacterium CG11_big_fil_rev_8_21_14_0_20_46_22]|nr:MAG: hypothetical protein COW05_00925 [Gammaproteobacteria bacterium CG12_big_fil_rev_8_21_14_0_65_46_12]PIR10524.1 MAG: hypothetical protein COV52_08455 [Gammaproteobacteria bacterium CG11_big_fil_rev_8_21_14_0_20_46_22]
MLLSRFLKRSLLILLPLCLAACHDHNRYTYFMSNHEVLGQAVTNCGVSQSAYCKDARASLKALKDFSSLAIQNRQVFEQVQSAGSIQSLSPDLKAQLMAAETDAEVLFGQHISLAQVKLADLQEHLRKAPANQKAALNAAIDHQERLIKAMYAIAWLNNPEG